MSTFRQAYLKQRGATRGLDAKAKLLAIEWATFYTAGDIALDAGIEGALVGKEVNRMVFNPHTDSRVLNRLWPLRRMTMRIRRFRHRIDPS